MTGEGVDLRVHPSLMMVLLGCLGTVYYVTPVSCVLMLSIVVAVGSISVGVVGVDGSVMALSAVV